MSHRAGWSSDPVVAAGILPAELAVGRAPGCDGIRVRQARSSSAPGHAGIGFKGPLNATEDPTKSFGLEWYVSADRTRSRSSTRSTTAAPLDGRSAQVVLMSGVADWHRRLSRARLRRI
jgi:hypothetical protein